MSTVEQLSRMLSEYRSAHKLSQEEMAKLCGIPVEYYRRVEMPSKI